MSVEHLWANYSFFRLVPRGELPGQRGWAVLRFLSHVTRRPSRKMEPISRGSSAVSPQCRGHQEFAARLPSDTDKLFELKPALCRAQESQLKRLKRILSSLILNHLRPQLLPLPAGTLNTVCLNIWVPQRTVFKDAVKIDCTLSLTTPSLRGHLGLSWGAIQNELSRLWLALTSTSSYSETVLILEQM